MAYTQHTIIYKIIDIYIKYSYLIPFKGEAGEQFMEQLFRIFDKDGDGSIDFKEFMIATDMTSSGDPEEKLRWAFRMYDVDGNGSIDFNEMRRLIQMAD